MKWIVGIDEVGRGPLAGPMTVCVFAIQKSYWPRFKRYARKYGLSDSKKLSKNSRLFWSTYFKKEKDEGRCLYTTISISPAVLDNRGMTWAAKDAIRRGLLRLQLEPQETVIRLDGLLVAPRIFEQQETIIGGDGKHMEISAASVIAKVYRDVYMERKARLFPEYGFEIHKGYGTKKHIMAIQKHGLCPLHRKTFCRRIDVA